MDRIDAAAGRLLLGASPEQRARLGDAAFRPALLDAARRAEAGQVGIDAVQAFMNPVPLRVGDAVTIPPRVPHSLQKGVHVIEFQTPVFERKILAAGQAGGDAIRLRIARTPSPPWTLAHRRT